MVESTTRKTTQLTHQTAYTYARFELLAAALAPRFGNLYEYNLSSDDGLDAQPWTDELRTAVRQYLLHELPQSVALHLFGTSDDSRETAVDELLDYSQPWEVGLAVREAAVSVVPTLDELLGDATIWRSEDEQQDAVTWLEAHGDTQVWKALARETNQRKLLPVVESAGQQRGPEPDDLVQALSPRELCTAWRAVVGPAASDLTDAEWALLVPYLPPAERTTPWTPSRLEGARRFFDSLLYKHTYDLQWSEVPERYGKTTTLQVRFYIYGRRKQVFSRALKALDGNPDATRLVAWLRAIAS